MATQQTTYKSAKPDAIVGGKAVVYNNQGKILILRRSEISAVSPGTWDFPGGKLEKGEDPIEGVKREILEETGLKSYSIKPIDVISFTNQQGQFVVVVGYKVFVRSKQVKLSQEHDQFMWVSPQEAINIPLKERHLRFLKQATLSS